MLVSLSGPPVELDRKYGARQGKDQWAAEKAKTGPSKLAGRGAAEGRSFGTRASVAAVRAWWTDCPQGGRRGGLEIPPSVPIGWAVARRRAAGGRIGRRYERRRQ